MGGQMSKRETVSSTGTRKAIRSGRMTRRFIAMLGLALLGALAVGGAWLMKTQPSLLRAIDARVRGSYFALSLPFP